MCCLFGCLVGCCGEMSKRHSKKELGGMDNHKRKNDLLGREYKAVEWQQHWKDRIECKCWWRRDCNLPLWEWLRMTESKKKPLRMNWLWGSKRPKAKTSDTVRPDEGTVSASVKRLQPLLAFYIGQWLVCVVSSWRKIQPEKSDVGPEVFSRWVTEKQEGRKICHF